jgi:transposase
MFMLDHGLYRLLWRQIMSDSNHARPGRPSETLARRRAEVILKVRAGLLTATEAAKELGVSRKTYYQWENRGLQAMLEALSDRPPGRPAKETDPEKEALKRKVGNLEKELGLKQKGIEIRDLLHRMEQQDGGSEDPASRRARSGTPKTRKKSNRER